MADREQEQRIPADSIAVNFYRPPRTVPAEGVEVIFSGGGVLIGDGWFPLSASSGRRLQCVKYNPAYPSAIEFDLLPKTSVRTSSGTIGIRRSMQSLRVPVAMEARHQAGEVVGRYEAILAQAR